VLVKDWNNSSLSVGNISSNNEKFSSEYYI